MTLLPGVGMPDAVPSEISMWAAANPRGAVVMSQARHDDVDGLLPRGTATEVAPVVRGRTVWGAAAPDPVGHGRRLLFVVDTPNLYGCVDASPPGEALVIDRSRGIGRWDDQVRTARHLGRSLAQIRGVALPFGDPEAPWFVITTPVDPGRVAMALDGAAVLAAVLGTGHPGLPGGLWLRTPPVAGSGGAQGEAMAECVASVDRVVSERSS